jgi:hypothetical protein
MVSDGTDPRTATRGVVVWTLAIAVPMLKRRRFVLASRGTWGYGLVVLFVAVVLIVLLKHSDNCTMHSIWVPGYIPAGVNWPCSNMRET